MSLNPSCNLDGELVGFPNLGDPPFPAKAKDTALAELSEAGIPRGVVTFTTREAEVYKPGSEAAQLGRCGIVSPDACARSGTTWINVHDVTAEAYGWSFRRNWYYWVCFTKYNPLPLSAAAELFTTHGKEVRTEGSCACPAPSRDVTGYHVDTPRGLKALVAVLRREHECREAEHRTEMERLYGKP
ncbi:MAG: hypothetical protein WC683_02610 [bacterium]